MNAVIVYVDTMSTCLIAFIRERLPASTTQLWAEWSLQGATFHRLKPQTEWGTLTGLIRKFGHVIGAPFSFDLGWFESIG